jgi:hypothetical protein
MHANVNIISQKSEHMLAESFAFRDIEVIKHTQKTFRYIATHGHAYTYKSRSMQQANHSDI